MSKLRKAAAAALEAYSLRDYDFGKYMEALRAALVQQDEPVQEPVAWIDDSGHPKHRLYLQSATEKRLYGPLRPLYTTPPQRKPLTPEDINRLWHDSGAGVELSRFSSIARAVERTHGIKE